MAYYIITSVQRFFFPGTPDSQYLNRIMHKVLVARITEHAKKYFIGNTFSFEREYIYKKVSKNKYMSDQLEHNSTLEFASFNRIRTPLNP